MKVAIFVATILSMVAATVAQDPCRDACKNVYRDCRANNGDDTYCRAIESMSLSIYHCPSNNDFSRQMLLSNVLTMFVIGSCYSGCP